jgi:hypothetical protein
MSGAVFESKAPTLYFIFAGEREGGKDGERGRGNVPEQRRTREADAQGGGRGPSRPRPVSFK